MDQTKNLQHPISELANAKDKIQQFEGELEQGERGFAFDRQHPELQQRAGRRDPMRDEEDLDKEMVWEGEERE